MHATALAVEGPEVTNSMLPTGVKLNCSPACPLSATTCGKNWSRLGGGIRLKNKSSASLRSGINASDRISARVLHLLSEEQPARQRNPAGGADAIRTVARQLPASATFCAMSPPIEC